MGKSYPKKVIQKKLSTNKWCKKYYPEELSKKMSSKWTPLYIIQMTPCHFISGYWVDVTSYSRILVATTTQEKETF